IPPAAVEVIFWPSSGGEFHTQRRRAYFMIVLSGKFIATPTLCDKALSALTCSKKHIQSSTSCKYLSKQHLAQIPINSLSESDCRLYRSPSLKLNYNREQADFSFIIHNKSIYLILAILILPKRITSVIFFFFSTPNNIRRCN
ncbi:hypothetical protein LCGC14_1602230, partial [marine sediment metagenome]